MFQGAYTPEGRIRATFDASAPYYWRGALMSAGAFVVVDDTGQSIVGRVNGLPQAANGALIVDQLSAVTRYHPAAYPVNARGALIVRGDTVTPDHISAGLPYTSDGAMAFAQLGFGSALALFPDGTVQLQPAGGARYYPWTQTAFPYALTVGSSGDTRGFVDGSTGAIDPATFEGLQIAYVGCNVVSDTFLLGLAGAAQPAGVGVVGVFAEGYTGDEFIVAWAGTDYRGSNATFCTWLDSQVGSTVGLELTPALSL